MKYVIINNEGEIMKLKLIYILGILLVLFVGCAKPPLAEMENAREQVFRAENDPDAVMFAGSTLERARSSLRRMQEESDNKNYEAAKVHATEAIASAERAIAEGRLGASRAREEAAALLSNLRPEIEETERNVNGARYSNLDLDYNDLERGISNAHDSADRAEASQANGRYQDAMSIARDVRSDLNGINDKVANAATLRKK